MIELLISSAVLITVLAVMRFLFRRRIPSGFQYAVWLLVLLRLALPFHLFPSPVSAAGSITQALQVEQTDAVEQPVSQPNPNSSIEEERRHTPSPGAEQLLRYGWPAGSAAAAIWFGLVNGKLAVRLRRTRRRTDIAAPVPIYVADGISSPCLYGLFHPAVYLTEQAAADPQRARMTVTHELTHWRHRDHIWSAARVLCLIVYWFDPFVWLAARLSKQDGELYCDECAIRSLGEKYRFSYGRVLLELSEAGVSPSDLLCSASTMSGGARRMRERIASIAERPKRSLSLCILMAVGVLAAVACTFSGAAEAQRSEPDAVISISPPFIVETPAPDEQETDAQEAVPQTPDPTQVPNITPTPAAQNSTSTPVLIEAADREDATDSETPSAGGGTPQTQRVQESGDGSTPIPTLQLEETDPPADETMTPDPTPPPDEVEPIIVRDMREAYMNSDYDPYPDMPSTVPDTPQPSPVDMQ